MQSVPSYFNTVRAIACHCAALAGVIVHLQRFDPSPPSELSQQDFQALRGLPTDDSELSAAAASLIGQRSWCSALSQARVLTEVKEESDEFASVEEKVKASINGQNEVPLARLLAGASSH